MEKLRKLMVGWGLLGVLALVVSACGSSNGPSSSGSGKSTASSSGNSGAGAQPGSLKDGTLNVFSSGDYPPYSYLGKDGKTMLGLENDLLEAITNKLGVKLKYNVAPFDTGIPAIANGRADVMVEGMADTAERRKQVDFLDLYKTTYTVVTKKGNPANINLGSDPATADPMGLCGHTSAAVQGSGMQASTKILSARCVKAGKPPIKLLVFSVGTQEYLSVKTGRADFDLMVPANAHYMEGQNPDLEALPGSFPDPQSGYTGWIFAKSNSVLQRKLADTINQLIKDGTWDRILAKYGVGKNDAVLPPMRNSRPFSE
jgi:polar amino acid transport system substrate-binding protein